MLAFIEKNLCGRLGSLDADCVGWIENQGKAMIDQLINTTVKFYKI